MCQITIRNFLKRDVPAPGGLTAAHVYSGVKEKEPTAREPPHPCGSQEPPRIMSQPVTPLVPSCARVRMLFPKQQWHRALLKLQAESPTCTLTCKHTRSHASMGTSKQTHRKTRTRKHRHGSPVLGTLDSSKKQHMASYFSSGQRRERSKDIFHGFHICHLIFLTGNLGEIENPNTLYL